MAKIKRLEGAIQRAEDEATTLGTSVVVPIREVRAFFPIVFTSHLLISSEKANPKQSR